jgi:hypothetical protein
MSQENVEPVQRHAAGRARRPTAWIMRARVSVDIRPMTRPKNREDRWSALSEAWLRALVVYPALFVLPWLVPCVVVSVLPGSAIGDVAWGFYLGPLAAGATFVVALLTLDVREFVEALGLALAGSAIALVVGLGGWFEAAQIACHGAYECPF